MASWNHRVVKRRHKNKQKTIEWSLRETHYDDDKKVIAVTRDATTVSTFSELGGPKTDKEALKELRWTLSKMIKALDEEILNYESVGK